MTDKSKTPATEELNSDDLDKVQGGAGKGAESEGYTEVEWTVKGEGKGWNIEQGSALKDAKDSDTKG